MGAGRTNATALLGSNALEGGSAPVIVQQTLVAAKPIAVSKSNCLELLGVEPRALGKFLRKLGVATVTMPSGPCALIVDVEAAMRARGQVVSAVEKTPAVAVDPDAAVLARAGLRMVGGR